MSSTALEILGKIGVKVRDCRIVGHALPEQRQKACENMAELVKLAVQTCEMIEKSRTMGI